MNPENYKILVVDDNDTNIDVLCEALSDSYDVRVAKDGESALALVQDFPPDLILLDIMMPGIDGYEVCQKLKDDPKLCKIPVIFLTALSAAEDEAKGLELGAVDFITKPFNPGLVKARVRNQVELKGYRDYLEQLVKERTKQLELTQETTIECIVNMAEYRQYELTGHIKRTQIYATLLAKKLKDIKEYNDIINDDFIYNLRKSVPLHDIGKVAIPDGILLKPMKLSDAEFEVMKKHTVYGKSVLYAAVKKLGEDSFLKLAIEIAESHHENWDGSGYPYGLSGKNIPLSGRLMALADVYDALLSKRVYKNPFSESISAEIIIDESGKKFDPDIVSAFIELRDKFKEIALKFADSDDERKIIG